MALLNSRCSLQTVINILLRDLEQAEAAIAKLTEENVSLRRCVDNFENNSWLSNRKSRPTCHQNITTFELQTSNKFSVLANENHVKYNRTTVSSGTLRNKKTMSVGNNVLE